jgi:tetratricopeptide (TPR) repeat protein
MLKKSILTFIVIFLITLIITTTAGSIIYNEFFSSSAETEVYQVSYEITNIPYVGIFNNEGLLRQSYLRTASGATLINVLEYWFPGENDIQVIDSTFSRANQSSDFGVIQAYLEIDDDRLDSRTESITVNQIGNYLNEQDAIPLITNLPIWFIAEGEQNYEPLTLVVGLNTQKQTLTLQNYWLGRYTLTFQEYARLQESSFEPYNYLVLTPKNNDLVTKSEKDFSGEYPVLSITDRDMFIAYAKADAFARSTTPATAISNYELAYNSESFNTFMPPAMRVTMLSRYAQTLFELKRYEEAFVVVEKAIQLNSNLALPFGTFASYDYLLNNNAENYRDRLSLPHITAGDIYRLLGQNDKAIEQYEIALLIFPEHIGPKIALDNLLTEKSE